MGALTSKNSKRLATEKGMGEGPKTEVPNPNVHCQKNDDGAWKMKLIAFRFGK